MQIPDPELLDFILITICYKRDAQRGDRRMKNTQSGEVKEYKKHTHFSVTCDAKANILTDPCKSITLM